MRIDAGRGVSLGSVDNRDLERDMSANRSVSGANAKEGLSPFERLRRQNGRFAPYPVRTRRISALNALKRACGD